MRCNYGNRWRGCVLSWKSFLEKKTQLLVRKFQEKHLTLWIFMSFEIDDIVVQWIYMGAFKTIIQSSYVSKKACGQDYRKYYLLRFKFWTFQICTWADRWPCSVISSTTFPENKTTKKHLTFCNYEDRWRGCVISWKENPTVVV